MNVARVYTGTTRVHQKIISNQVIRTRTGMKDRPRILAKQTEQFRILRDNYYHGI